MSQSSSKQIVFISGTFISNNCWDEWINYFTPHGYNCIAPTWPYKGAPAEDLRNRPSDDPIALNTINSVTDLFAAIINTLPEKPVLIGLSLGGLIVQLLVQRQLAAAGVALHSFSPQGINRFRITFLRALWETMVLFASSRFTYLISFRKWKNTIANNIGCGLQKELYYKYAIPESKKIIRDIFRCFTKIDFGKAHSPLLFIAGGNDKLVPTAIIYSNYEKNTNIDSITDYKEFSTHPHLSFGHGAWKKEAQFIIYWLKVLQ